MALGAAGALTLAPRLMGGGVARPRPAHASASPAQPGFAAAPVAGLLAAPADVSMGWDGTAWAVDQLGAPHTFDPLQQTWQTFGDGVSAVAYAPAAPGTPGGLYVFRGGEVILLSGVGETAPAPTGTPTPTPTSSPQPSASAQPTHPPGLITPQPTHPPGLLTPQPTHAMGLITPTPQPTHPTGLITPTPQPTHATGLFTPVPPRESPPVPPAGVDEGQVVRIVLAGAPAAQSTMAPLAPSTASPTPQATPFAPLVTPAQSATGTPARATTPTAGATATPSPTAAVTAPAGLTTPTPGATSVVTPAPLRPPPGVPPGATPQPIGAVWPALPPSFQLGVDGAANAGGVLYLFRGGRYVRPDGTAPPVALAELAGWPQTPAWRDGVVDLVGSGHDDAVVAFVREGEVLLADLASGTVTVAPIPLGEGFKGAVLARLQAGGVDALLYDGSPTSATVPLRLFRGPTVTTYTGTQPTTPGTAAYLPTAFAGWPSLWNPVLLQAPAGRVGALWSVDHNTHEVITHDGQGWSEVPLPQGATGVPSLTAGADGAVFAGSGSTLYRLDPPTSGGAGGWRALANAPGPVAQATAGDAGHVWVRGQDGSVHRYGGGTGGAFTPVSLGSPAMDVDANADGTLWHCDGTTPAAFRLISEGSRPPEALAVAGGAAVQKVASTGFGTGLVLAGQGGAPRLYTYQSPYLWKTGPSYISSDSGPLDSGAGALFLSTWTPGGAPGSADGHLVALETLTGQERWRRDVGGTSFTSPVYDPLLQLAYIAGTDGVVSALDAHTGETTWEYRPGAVVDARPALAGNRLVFGARDGRVYCLDTAQAQADYLAGKGGPQPVWVTLRPVASGVVGMATPLAVDDKVYAGAWVQLGAPPPGGAPPGAAVDRARPTPTPTPAPRPLYAYALSRIDAATGAIDWTVQPPGQGVDSQHVTDLPLGPPVLGQAQFSPAVGQAVIVNGKDSLLAVRIDDVTEAGWSSTFRPPALELQLTSGLVLQGGRLYAGDNAGRIWIVDPATWSVLYSTPGAPGGGVVATPVVSGPPGSETVFYAPYDPGLAELRVLDVATGVVATLATGQTAIATLSRGIEAGVLYATGAVFGAAAGLGQALAIRADAAAAAAHAVIAESQLLQDFDDPSGGPGAGAAVKVARYQTHLTVLDDLEQPRALETIKLWADEDTTVVVDGTTFKINATTAASVQTGADGTLVIVSDAADLFAPRLTLWAAFMDPAERLVIWPDQEFHARLAATVAVPTDDDPGQINLSTTSDYGGTRLFSDQQQQQAQNVAGGVRQLCAAVGLGTPSPAAALAAGASLGAGPVNPRKYIAYPDGLPGLAYAPSSQPVTRPLTAATPFGLVLDETGALKPLSPTEAAEQIDGLQADAPAALQPPLLGDVLGWLRHLWDGIKRAAVSIEKLVLSVARDVALGIQYVENGVKKVFRAVVHAVEDAVAAIGSFFVKLGKLVKNIVEALSIIFHLDKILSTKSMLEDSIKNELDSMVSDITNSAMPAVDNFFKKAEQDILNDFSTLISEAKSTLDPHTARLPVGVAIARYGAPARQTSGPMPLSGLNGMGATAHSAFSVGPAGSQQTQSHAVQCAWAGHTLTRQMGKATPVGDSVALTAGGDPLSDFLTGFVQRLSSDADLKQAYDQTTSDFRKTFEVKDVRQFLTMAVVDFLDVLEGLVVGTLAIARACLGGMLQALADGIGIVQGLGSLRIPILSSLLEPLIGHPLTFVDLVTFVAAIPITIIYRAVDGHWPGDTEKLAQAGAAAGGATVRRLGGLLGGLAYIFAGWVTAMLDTIKISSGSGGSAAPPALPFKIAGVMLLLGGIGNAIYQGIREEGWTDSQWIVWGLGLTNLALTAVGGAFKGLSGTGYIFVSFFSLLLTFINIDLFKGKTPGESPLLFGAQVLLAIPGIIGPIMLLPADSLAPYIAPVADFAFRVAGGALFIAETATHWNG
jgi:outer membrane protein assembly factor BamB